MNTKFSKSCAPSAGKAGSRLRTCKAEVCREWVNVKRVARSFAELAGVEISNKGIDEMKLLETLGRVSNRAPDLAAMKVVIQLSTVILASSGALLAQTNTENSPNIQFNLVVPGARSLAIGGAFLARADDATAAYTNPAGLTALSRPEISIEGRSWGFNHIFTDSGRVDGSEPTGIGTDTISGLRTGEAENDVLGFSFFSYVYPASRRWRFAFYRHELANFEARFGTQGNFLHSRFAAIGQ